MDSFYDRIGDDSEREEEFLSHRLSESSVEISTVGDNPEIPVVGDNHAIFVAPLFRMFNGLSVDLIALVLSFCSECSNFSQTCRFSRNLVSSLTDFRIFQAHFACNAIPNNRLIDFPHGNAAALNDILRAFGNGSLRVDFDSLVEGNLLELALCSPAFRNAAALHIWPQLHDNCEAFRNRIETLAMAAQDPIITLPSIDSESFRRSLLYILSSLPQQQEPIAAFFNAHPFPLLTPETEPVFNNLCSEIYKRIRLLPIGRIIHQILPQFAFDTRLRNDLVEFYLQTAQHANILRFISTPTLQSDNPRVYCGLLDVRAFLRQIRQHLNLLDHQILNILATIQETAAFHPFTEFSQALLPLGRSEQLSLADKFHVAILKTDWTTLESFDNFDFSYMDSDNHKIFLDHLIARDQQLIFTLLDRIPKLITHRSFLLNPQFQGRHFNSFDTLRQVRIELKRTIPSCHEITLAHIVYLQDTRERLFRLLLADSAERIAKYFTLNLKGPERRRYKDHPSFHIAITTVDTHITQQLQQQCESFLDDPEIALTGILASINALPSNPNEFFELAHELPSFAAAYNSEQTAILLLSPASTALHNSRMNIDILSRTIALNQVIRDGTNTHYRLVLDWFEQFGLGFCSRVMPQVQLKRLLKEAAFRTTTLVDSNHIKFNLLDPLSRDDPLSLTYKYAFVIVAIQCKGNPSATLKRLNNIFPGADFRSSPRCLDLIQQATNYYRAHQASFFSKFKFVATNSPSERFLIDFIALFIKISRLNNAPLSEIISSFFAFISLDPHMESLLKDHFIYFILIASFKSK
jgi:hypothetical protein